MNDNKLIDKCKARKRMHDFGIDTVKKWIEDGDAKNILIVMPNRHTIKDIRSKLMLSMPSITQNGVTLYFAVGAEIDKYRGRSYDCVWLNQDDITPYSTDIFPMIRRLASHNEYWKFIVTHQRKDNCNI